MGAISGCGYLLSPQPKSSFRCFPTTHPPRPHVLFASTTNATRARVQCIRCQSPNAGEDDSKAVLDAFFLGKAFAELLTERVESTVGEFLSVIGQWQAEQQKQVQDFQEEVLERAKKAKEKAAREAMAGQASETKSLTASSGNGNPTSPSSDATKPI
ncbi:uncharacterized protein At4g13200, chloroplastic [Nymphaea colorata]|nr:uncharacterized protein At4g13200, chloroplastic [Nymphaea colorata]